MKKHHNIAVFLILLLMCPATALAADLESAAEAFGSGTRKILDGIGKGFGTQGEKGDQLRVELSPALQKKQVVLNSAKRSGIEDVLLDEGITCYLLSPTMFQETLVAWAYSADGKEIGRSREKVILRAGEAATVVFRYPRSLDTRLVAKYVIDLSTHDTRIYVDETLEEKTGLRLSDLETPGQSRFITLQGYAVATKSFDGKLIAVAFAEDGRELDRAAVALTLNPKESRHLTFSFSSNAAPAASYSIEYLAETGLGIEASSSLSKNGLSMPRAEDAGMNAAKRREVVCYIIAEKPFFGTLIARALDEDGREIGRGTQQVALNRDDAQEVVLSFPPNLRAQAVAKFVVSARAEEKSGSK